ncbi:MAG: diguanylate cyclase, partial [Clostridiales bacterium]
MDEEYHTPKWWIAVAVASVILILILGYGFVTRASNGLYAEKVAYLEEISVKGAALVTAQVSGYFSTLEAMSTVIGREDDFSADSALAILRPEAEKGFFKRMGIIMPDGIAYTTDGYKEDFSDRVYFHTAMTGERAVSDCLVDKIGGEAINVFAAPVYRDDTIICTVFVTKSQEELSKALTFESFCGEGYSYIVSGDGRPVVQTTHPASIGNYTDFFASMLKCGVTEEQVTTVRRQMAANDTGVLEYKRDGISRQIFYAPVGINNWYIFSVVPSQAISMQSDRLIRNLCILVVLWVLLSMAICSRMLHSFRLNNKRLSHIAYTDATTGHPNWARFRLEAQRLLKENPDRHYAMIAFDINKFKEVNDEYGHQVGDECIKLTGQIIKDSFQKIGYC